MRKKKVLIIEDDKFLIKLYGDTLRRNNFEVVDAATGGEGFHKALKEKPDLIILDLVLPRKSGFEVLSEIKTNSEIKDTPVIILSNLGQDSDIKRGKDLGAVSYLVKSDFSVNKLPEIVKEEIAKSK